VARRLASLAQLARDQAANAIPQPPCAGGKPGPAEGLPRPRRAKPRRCSPRAVRRCGRRERRSHPGVYAAPREIGESERRWCIWRQCTPWLTSRSR
jgi:hypothetical protein